MLRPLLLATLLCFPGISAMAYHYAWLKDVNDFITFPTAPRSSSTPVVVNSLPDHSQSLTAGSFSIDLSEVFSDTDGNDLSFSAVSNKTEIATVTIEGSLLTVTPVSLGSCRIRATARDDNNGKADDTFTLTIGNNQPPSLTPEATLGNQVLFSGGIPLILDLAAVFFDPDGDILLYSADSNQESVAQVSINQETLTVTPNLEGEALISLSANDQNGGILLESFTVEVQRSYPATLDVNVRVVFEDFRDQGNYRMIALPGDQSIFLSNTTSGNPNQDWVAYAPDPSNSGQLIPFERSVHFVLTPGRGLWFLSKRDWVQSKQAVSTVSLNAEGVYDIPLHPGWNIISNPLDQDIPWAAIVFHNNVSQGIWRWGHGYQKVDTFHSTANIPEAYYFNNIEGLERLELPYSFTASPSKKSSPAKEIPINLAEVEVVNPSTQEISSVSLKWTTNASEGFDVLDQLAPPAHFNTLALSLVPAHPDFNQRPLAVESRPAAARVHQFDLQLKSSQGEYVTFNLSESEKQFAEDVLIVNRLDTKTYNLKELQGQQIFLDADITPFSLFFGDRLEIERALESLTPSIFSLKQNYPNPFNPITTIEYSIPTAQHVDLSVFDLMGRHIITLQQGEKEAGLHRVQWQGLDPYQNRVANGVYFYRLQTRSWTQSQKMTLIH